MEKWIIISALIFIMICSFVMFILSKQEAKKEKPNAKKVKILLYCQLLVGVLLIIMTIICMQKF